MSDNITIKTIQAGVALIDALVERNGGVREQGAWRFLRPILTTNTAKGALAEVLRADYLHDMAVGDLITRAADAARKQPPDLCIPKDNLPAKRRPARRCSTCDGYYDDTDPEQVAEHEHPEPQGGPYRAAWLASRLPFEKWAETPDGREYLSAVRKLRMGRRKGKP